MRKIGVIGMVTALLAMAPVTAAAESPVALKHDRPTLEARWRARLKSFLDRGIIPLVDLESSLREPVNPHRTVAQGDRAIAEA